MNRIFALLASVAALAASAVDINIEGRWLENGVPAPLFNGTCTLALYGAESGGDALGSASAVPFATDADAYFVVSAAIVPEETLPDTYWVGVTPAGGSEIVPRFRVAPAPFALAADFVKVLRSESELSLSGEATIDRIDVAGDATVKNWTIAPDSTVNVRNLQLANARLEKLTLCDAGMLGFFDNQGADPSYDYDSFVPEKSVSVMANVYLDWVTWGGYNLYAKPRTRADSWTFDTDGILMVALKAEPKKCPASRVTLKVGKTTILDNYPLGTDGDGSLATDVVAASVKRFMTIPYRAGEQVQITVQASGFSDKRGWGLIFNKSQWESTAGAKVRLLRFGRK